MTLSISKNKADYSYYINDAVILFVSRQNHHITYLYDNVLYNIILINSNE